VAILLDFQDGSDHLGLTKGLKFKGLEIERKGKNTLISDGNDLLAVINGVKLNQISAADFTKL
jgi:hypothetical protein